MWLAMYVVSEPKQMSTLLQEQFTSVFSTPRYQEVAPGVSENSSAVNIESVVVDEDGIVKSIGCIKSGSAPGPDGIPPILLKSCADTLKAPLKTLWEKSFNLGLIPVDLKCGVIVPLHKGGSRCDVKNYRPITLTSHLIKIFERIIAKNLVNYMEETNLFNPRQHGFRASRSCLSQLLEHYQEVLSMMETGCAADVIYLDFAKAFDKVDHGILLRKLRAMGIGGPMLTWIQEFLVNRSQLVSVYG